MQTTTKRFFRVVSLDGKRTTSPRHLGMANRIAKDVRKTGEVVRVIPVAWCQGRERVIQARCEAAQ